MKEWEMDSFFYCVFVLNVWNSLHSSSLYNQPPACRSETLAGLQPGAARTQRSTPVWVFTVGPIGRWRKGRCVPQKEKPWRRSGFSFMWGVRCAGDGNTKLFSEQKTKFESVSKDLRAPRRDFFFLPARFQFQNTLSAVSQHENAEQVSWGLLCALKLLSSYCSSRN